MLQTSPPDGVSSGALVNGRGPHVISQVCFVCFTFVHWACSGASGICVIVCNCAHACVNVCGRARSFLMIDMVSDIAPCWPVASQLSR